MIHLFTFQCVQMNVEFLLLKFIAAFASIDFCIHIPVRLFKFHTIFHIPFDKVRITFLINLSTHLPILTSQWIYCVLKMRWPFCHWQLNSHVTTKIRHIKCIERHKVTALDDDISKYRKENGNIQTRLRLCNACQWRTRSHSITIRNEELRISFVVLFAFPTNPL